MTVRAWWRDAVIYQIYPRSFGDANGDGIGDLPGIGEHLDYLESLGVDGVWLSPFYPSPMADFGYDVSDYTDVDPVFGTLGDFDRLVDSAHARGLRVIIDWVPNHTSERHAWFVNSRSSRESPQRDWYVWRDPAPDGGPPNNWQSQFPRVGSGWTFDAPTGQWYLHSYLPAQPDLNWANPAVAGAMADVLRFWLNRGVDGFRIDVPQRLGKDPSFRDNPGLANEPLAAFVGRRYDEDQPAAHERLRAIRRVVDEFADRLIVGEVYVLDQRRMATYVNSGDELHLAHNFTFLRLDWDADAFRRTLIELGECLDPAAWPAWCLGNHDHSRIASRFGSDGRGPERGRLLGLLLLTLRGTPFIYYGDELGLPDSAVPSELALDIHDRDRARAPIPWLPPSRAGVGAGFSDVVPWLPVAPNADALSVETQAADPGSTLSMFREILRLRRSSPVLRAGDIEYRDGHSDVLAFERRMATESWLIALNFAVEPRPLDGFRGSGRKADLVFTTDTDRPRGRTRRQGMMLGPLEGIVLRMSDGGASA